MEVKVTSKLAEGLTDGFTGRPLEVFMEVKAKSPPMFYCPNAFSVHVPYDSLEALQDAVSMKNGVCGLRDATHPTCPYMGVKLKLRLFPDGRFAYAGGLNPRRAFESLEDLVYHLSMRDGKTDMAKPEAHAVAVTKPKEGDKYLPEQNAPSDATKEAVEKAVVAAGLPRQTQVSMSVPTKKKGGKK